MYVHKNIYDQRPSTTRSVYTDLFFVVRPMPHGTVDMASAGRGHARTKLKSSESMSESKSKYLKKTKKLTRYGLVHHQNASERSITEANEEDVEVSQAMNQVKGVLHEFV